MAIPLDVTVKRRSRDLYGGLQVEWWPALEEVREFVTHGAYFEPGWIEADVSAYAQASALVGIWEAIESFFPGEYEPGSVV